MRFLSDRCGRGPRVNRLTYVHLQNRRYLKRTCWWFIRVTTDTDVATALTFHLSAGVYGVRFGNSLTAFMNVKLEYGCERLTAWHASGHYSETLLSIIFVNCDVNNDSCSAPPIHA